MVYSRTELDALSMHWHCLKYDASARVAGGRLPEISWHQIPDATRPIAAHLLRSLNMQVILACGGNILTPDTTCYSADRSAPTSLIKYASYLGLWREYPATRYDMLFDRSQRTYIRSLNMQVIFGCGRNILQPDTRCGSVARSANSH
jgi:hypothetical protein